MVLGKLAEFEGLDQQVELQAKMQGIQAAKGKFALVQTAEKVEPSFVGRTFALGIVLEEERILAVA